MDEHVEGAELGRLLRHPLRGDVAAQQLRLGAVRRGRLGRLLGGLVVAQVADHDLGRTQPGEAQGDLLADPAASSRHEDGRAGEHAHEAGGCGADAGAWLGRLFPPIRSGGCEALALLGFRRGVAQAVEHGELLLRVGAHRMALGEARTRAP